MKTKYFLTVLFLGIAFIAGAAEARIDLFDFNRKVIVERTGISEGGRLQHFTWEKDGGKWGSMVHFPVTAEWTKTFIKVKPEADVSVVVSLMGPDVRRSADSPREKVRIEYSAVTLNGEPLLKGGKNIIAWHDERHDLYAKMRQGEVYTIAFTCRLYQEPVTIAAGKEFMPIDTTDLAVRTGSALDLGFLVSDKAITEAERLTVKDGRFVLSSDLSKRVRLTGSSVNFRLEFFPLDKAGIKEYVALAKRQGYNLVRAHYLDAYLGWGAKKDLEFVPEYFDNFLYLIACMKEAGMYFSLDAMSAPSGYRAMKTDWSPYKGVPMGRALLFDPAIREEWKVCTDKILNTVNPYTGTKLVDDPILVNITPYNEQDHFFILRNPDTYRKEWQEFLVEKYGSAEKVLAAYGSSFPSLDKIRTDVFGAAPLGEDSRTFIFLAYQNMNRFFIETMRELGFKGYLSQYDCEPKFRFSILRSEYPVVAMHSYHAHPDQYLAPGSKLDQTSSVQTRGDYLTTLGTARFLDRPFMITEIGHVFWNRYRYEQGLMLGAYSAYQDYDCLIPHAGPVLFRGSRAMVPFGVGADPVCRASDVVANFLLLSNAVKPAPRTFEFVMKAGGMLKSGESEWYAERAVRDSLLMVRGGIRFSDLPVPEGVKQPAGIREIELDPRKQKQPEYMAEIYRKIASEGNASRPAEGYFVTDTGEIVLDSKKGYLQVVVPRLEGASSIVPMDFKLPNLAVKSSVPGSATVIALDGKTVAESKRLLLVIVGDALNEGMKFADPERTTLLANGRNPLLQVMKATITLKTRGKSAEIWPLRLNGERQTAIPVAMGEGALTAGFDTATLPGGPTVFFEIAVK